MPGLTKIEALLLSNDELRPGLLENASKRTQFLEKLPFYRIHGDRLQIARVPAGSLGLEPDFDTVPVTTQEGVAVPENAEFEAKLLVQDVFVRDYVGANLSAVKDQAELQIEAAKRRFQYKFMDAFFNGNQGMSSQEFSGLDVLIAGSKQILPNDGTNFYLALEDLARVAALVTSDDGWGPIVGVVNARGHANILKAYFDKGLAPEWLEMEFWDENGYYATRRILAFRGIPIFVDDHVKNDKRVGLDNDGTTITIFQVGRGGVYGITACEPMMDVRERIDAAESQTQYRITWSVGLVLERESAAALLTFRPQPGTTDI